MGLLTVSVVTTLTSHVTTVNNALDSISTLSNPNIYSIPLLAETATPRSTSADPKPFRELPLVLRRPRRQRDSTRAPLMKSFPRATPGHPADLEMCGIPTHKRPATFWNNPVLDDLWSCWKP